jgi:hypothetical protein
MLTMFACAAVFNFPQSSRAFELTQQDPTVTSRQIEKFPVMRRKPRITLRRALKIAETYAKREKINLSPYFLLEARMIQYGGENNAQEIRWFFRWVNENGTTGNDLEITVSMTGKASRLPSM